MFLENNADSPSNSRQEFTGLINMLELEKKECRKTSYGQALVKIIKEKTNVDPLAMVILGGGIVLLVKDPNVLAFAVVGVGATLYVTRDRFANFKKFYQKDFEIIDPNNLRTKEGREKYLQFIKTPNISPAEKLFGYKVDVQNWTYQQKKKHINSLMLHIHPDKLPDADDKAFKEVNLLAEKFFEKPVKQDSFDLNTSCKSNCDRQFSIFLEQGNWLRAKKLLNNNSQFIPLFALKEGDFLTAIQSCSESEQEIIQILERCQKNIENELCLNNVSHLLSSLDDIQRLQTIFMERLDANFIPKDIVPHKLYSAIAACYKESLEHAAEYQKYLRLAIRNCLCLKEKKQLIEDLKAHTESFKKSVMIDQKKCVFKEISDICSKLQMIVNKNSCTVLTKLIEEFLNNQDLTVLENLIKELEKITKNEFSGSGFLNKCIKNTIDKCFGYSDKQPAGFSQGLRLLQGTYCYLKGVNEQESGNLKNSKRYFGQAVSHFEENGNPLHPLFHALCRLGLKNYRGALTSFSKYPQNDFIEACAFEAMNEHDFAEEISVSSYWLLQEIDDHQFKILQTQFSRDPCI